MVFAYILSAYTAFAAIRRLVKEGFSIYLSTLLSEHHW